MEQLSATIRDVAREAGVSVATASRVLSGSSYPVKASVRARVEEAAQRLSYTPNSFARGLSKQESRLVGLLVPNISEPFFLEIGRGAERVLSDRGYLVVLCNTDREPEMERKYLGELRGLRSGAILVAQTEYDQSFLEEIASHPAPVVGIGRDLPCRCVQLDNTRGAVAATNHLIELGHRRIAFIRGALSSLSAADRLQGFRQAMSSHGIPVDERLVLSGDYSMESGAVAMRRLLADPPPDAVFAANDQMAIGAMHEAIQQGLAVPGDISIMGFNDVPIGAFVNPPLTTVALHLRKVGEAAARLLLRQMEALNGNEATITVPGELVVRGSTGLRPARQPGQAGA